ncbi:asparagine synthase (glutamine-hydrolyzing) [Streptomyces sp. NBC_01218]|uniref:asparagine synthase (glutamine-hydrolyzing) n=1 Tax=unclassified Streptomyces TaxID=2593676 RepID=UPI0023B99353|nr:MULTISPECIES: asparagine synthase (glutamine-hydrolyzing) [unclassified Streptomyces]WEH43345.1 asparagine synthase (glutamine-hydrolyzing) [Streptomyces sp. AM 2-1-1]WSQ54984.1 asparagine synthase (glutamine-hydrolyzing) [Streptomyces sp. NBC_01218]
MSAITGWVDFAHAAGAPDPIGVMTSALAGRGPGGEGLWRSAHAALGHRSTSTSSTQPLATNGTAGSGTVVTYAGRLSNAQPLRGQLRSLGREFTHDGSGGDAEVVLRAYEQWGEECVERIEGSYAFALWDERREELLLVRDRMGVKPLFYAPMEQGVLFGSEPKAILAHPLFTPSVDAGGLRDILSIARVPGHAMFRGMREVRPGCVVRVGREHRPSERTYWALRAGEHTDGLDKTVTTVRELLETVISEQFGPGGEPPASLLSGGLDSSSLTALAARTASGLGTGPVRTLAVNDQGADGTSGNDDHLYARVMAEHAGTDHHEISLAGLDLLDPRLRTDVLAAYDIPINKGDQYASLLSLFRAARRHAPVALSGELGDDVFGGYNWQRFDRWVHTDTFPWVAEGRSRFNGMATVFDAGLLAKLDLAAYEQDCHRDAIAELGVREAVADPAEARHREVTYLALTRHARVLFDRLDRLGMAAGLDIRVPFADPRLLAYAFDIPWSMKSHDGREKSVLRAAVRDILPEQVAMRVKTPYPNLRDETYDRVLRERLTAVVRAGDSPVLPLLSDGLRHGAALDGVGRPVLETALQLGDWLKTYGVRVEL